MCAHVSVFTYVCVLEFKGREEAGGTLLFFTSDY